MEFFHTSDVVSGDIIRFSEAVFAGSFRRPKFIGERTITATIKTESYGTERQQHTFILDVISCEGVEPIAAGTAIRRKGRNIYRNGVERASWTNEDVRWAATAEKHQRGDFARAARQERKNGVDRF